MPVPAQSRATPGYMKHILDLRGSSSPADARVRLRSPGFLDPEYVIQRKFTGT